ncbi:hypothetical protein [Raineya sp.]|jgi:hypothetical protein
MEKAQLKKIKKYLSNLIQRGKKISAFWDAGNDSCACPIEVDDVIVSYENPVEEYLSDLIVETLNLPNASEDNHYGRGIIHFNENGDLVITFDNIYETYWTENEELKKKEKEEYIFPIEDKFGICQFAHKAEIRAEYCYAPKQKYGETSEAYDSFEEGYFDVNFAEGDAFSISDEAKNYTFKLLANFAEILVKGEEENVGEFKGIKWDNIKTYPIPTDRDIDAFCNTISLVGYFLPNAQMKVVIERNFDYISYTKNKTVVLIPNT